MAGFRDLEIWDDLRKRLEKKSVTDLHAVVRPKAPIAWGSGSGVPCAWGLKKVELGFTPTSSADRELGLHSISRNQGLSQPHRMHIHHQLASCL